MTLVNDTLIKLNIILLHVEPAPPLASPLPAPALPRICRHPRSSETIKTNFTAALELAFLADNGNPGLAMHSSNKATKLATFEQRMKRILKCAAAGGVGGAGHMRIDHARLSDCATFKCRLAASGSRLLLLLLLLQVAGGRPSKCAA